jgi:uncharacterized damage-inducible protein DinB
MKEHLHLLATYNPWMNKKLYEAAARLTPAALAEDRGAFFGSLLGTLNHLVVADHIWLKRFATLPSFEPALRVVAELPDPAALDEIPFERFEALREHRQWLDGQILDWIDGLSESDLGLTLRYHNMKGVASARRVSHLLLHFFNHQTHHRGQATTLLSQVGEDVGITDLLMLIPEIPDE